jgi:HSP20 family protein
MANFLEKLKKGMEIEASEEEIVEEKKEIENKKLVQTKQPEKLRKDLEACPELKIKKIETNSLKPQKWSFRGEEEGRLAIDVYQTEKDLVVSSAIAGVSPEELDIKIEKDILTIRGRREKPSNEQGDYFIRECFWGTFSKEIILPVEVDSGRVSAEMKNGVLIIRMPKILRENKKKIEIKK